jgi:hypothetical protein
MKIIKIILIFINLILIIVLISHKKPELIIQTPFPVKTPVVPAEVIKPSDEIVIIFGSHHDILIDSVALKGVEILDSAGGSSQAGWQGKLRALMNLSSNDLPILYKVPDGSLYFGALEGKDAVLPLLEILYKEGRISQNSVDRQKELNYTSTGQGIMWVIVILLSSLTTLWIVKWLKRRR